LETENKQRLVFISHSSEDTWVAKQIAREIKSKGASTFLDESDIDIGLDFENEIRKFLKKTHELVVLVTPWALDRKYVIAEIGAAWVRQIPIIILLYGLTAQEFQSKPNVPVFLKSTNMIHLNDIDKYLNQLNERVEESKKNE
jgi:hypothetical protein